jgi:hypothetical protein
MTFDEVVYVVGKVGCVSGKMRRAEEVARRHQRRLEGASRAKRVQVFTLYLALNTFAVRCVADESWITE